MTKTLIEPRLHEKDLECSRLEQYATLQANNSAIHLSGALDDFHATTSSLPDKTRHVKHGVEEARKVQLDYIAQKAA